MFRSWWLDLVLVVILLGLIGFGVQATAAQDVPTMRIVSLTGSPQYFTPEVINAGTMVLELNTQGMPLSEFGIDQNRYSQMWVHTTDGRQFSFRADWDDNGDGRFLWDGYISSDVETMWMETSATVIWSGYGPG